MWGNVRKQGKERPTIQEEDEINELWIRDGHQLTNDTENDLTDISGSKRQS